MSGMNESKVEC